MVGIVPSCCYGRPSYATLKPSSTSLSSISIVPSRCRGPMAAQKGNWRLRTSMDSSTIVEMNRLLGNTHVERIRMTPFRWCLHILSPLEVNLKLLKDQNIKVDVALAVERLSLHGHASHRSKQDRQLPEIRAIFHMDDGGMSEGSFPERSKVEEADDESSNDDTWEAGAEERMRKNNKNIITLNAKIGVLMRELIEIYQTPIFNEEAACGNDEEGGGGGHEAPASGGDEEGDGGFDEEAAGGAAEDPAGAFNEQPGDDEPAHEDEKVSASHHPSVCIEIDDDGDDDEGEVPLAIPPLHSFVGDPTTIVDVDQLYYAVNKELLGIRKKYVCEWILDNENIRRMEALAEYGML
ncbi:uncharacterized protein HKW66_Vig0125960 [Vigna angularis]|uniref:Uncharacterized protein n=1 Tax=Phaseolus angularis TaxID=3914 RepID=A0A8T0K6I0_PHAAN|nr:uncharacterized protein HKW66_Vig0125960 [Vigna angularis]